MKRLLLLFLFMGVQAIALKAEDGYKLWLRYDKVENKKLLQQYQQLIHSFYCAGSSSTVMIIRNELQNGLSGLLDKKIAESPSIINNALVVCTGLSGCKMVNEIDSDNLGKEGFLIKTTHAINRNNIIIVAK